MKIGIFDSGLGGFVIARSIFRHLPQYDYIYLGDTARVPYGDRPQAEIYKFVEQAVSFLLAQDCQLIIVACNTASANALRKIQQQYLPEHYPDRRVLGVIIPTAEKAARYGRIGNIATTSTVRSRAYVRELKKLNPRAVVYQRAAGKLVPLIEDNRINAAGPVLQKYLTTLQKKHIEALILGCTHYPLLKEQIAKILGKRVRIIDQAEIIPSKLKSYLLRHPEISRQLSKRGKRIFYVTKRTESFEQVARTIMGRSVTLQTINLRRQK